MSTIQYEQRRGLTSAAHQYQHQSQYSNPYPLPQPNADYFQQSQLPSHSLQGMSYPPPPGPGANLNYQQSAQPQSPYEHEHPPPMPAKLPNPAYEGQSTSQYQQQQPPYEVAPPLPLRNPSHAYSGPNTDFPAQQPSSNPHLSQSPYNQNPSFPQSNQNPVYFPPNENSGYNAQAMTGAPQGAPLGGISGHSQFAYNDNTIPPPPQRVDNHFTVGDDPGEPTHYTRDPHKLVAYLVPFPKPQLPGIDPATIPTRFLIYTPPPPPLSAPKEGEKEAKLHKVQRKWQEEVRAAKTSNAKVASWQGVKSRATKAIAWGVNQTTTSNLEFLGRVSDGNPDSPSNSGSESSRPGSPTTKKTIGVSEMVLVYPPSIGLNDQQMREEFVNTMLRTKSKAQRDSIIATGLLPVGFGIDILATLIWPFGGLGEIDSVWLYSSLRGAKTAHSVTKRLTSSSSTGDLNKDTLQLNFTPSQRLDILQRYLEAECHRVDSTKFPTYRSPPTETEVLEAVGWHPSQSGGAEKNWEDEQWEMTEVKDDVKSNMHKGAKEWKKFCVAFAKDPEKAMKK